MHVTLIVPAPFDAVSGGYAYDRRMAEGLRALGHTVEVAELQGRFPLPDASATEAARAAWHALPAGTLPVIDGLALPAFAPLLPELPRAVGLIHHPTTLEHGHAEATRETLRGIERSVLPVLSRVIVTSPETAETIACEFGADRARVRVVTPGTDDAPRSSGSGAPGCAILSVGTLVPRKGHDTLLRALSRLLDLDWHLTIAGSADRAPAHAGELQALAEQLGMAARVTFAGEVDDAALDVLWRGADMFALATRWEGYGMAVAEALRRGLPVAVTAGGAAASLVPPEAGVVAPPGDHEQLSKAIRRLIFSAELRRYLGDAAWEAGRKLPSWPAQAAAFAEALR